MLDFKSPFVIVAFMCILLGTLFVLGWLIDKLIVKPMIKLVDSHRKLIASLPNPAEVHLNKGTLRFDTTISRKIAAKLGAIGQEFHGHHQTLGNTVYEAIEQYINSQWVYVTEDEKSLPKADEIVIVFLPSWEEFHLAMLVSDIIMQKNVWRYLDGRTIQITPTVWKYVDLKFPPPPMAPVQA